jgi:5-methylcytosine-specific restriction endonuclease McrA
MARHDRIKAWFQRRDLIKRLGGKCVDCGTKGTKGNGLEVDHPNGRTYNVRKMDASWRVYTYLREEREGVKLEVRCRRCNANAHKKNPGMAGRVADAVREREPGEEG